MKGIPVNGLKVGDCLSKDVFNDLGNIILSEGTQITEKHLAYFKRHQIDFVYIAEEVKRVEEASAYKLLTDEKYRQLSFCYRNVLDVYKDTFFKVQEGVMDADSLESLKTSLTPLLEELLKDNDVLGSLRLVSLEEDYQLTHAVNVSMLGAMIGKWLSLDLPTIREIALAGLLHDIGKAQISPALLLKKEEITPSESKIFQSHTQKGYELLKGNPNISKEVLAGVLFHHERSNGKGYPSGLTDEQTPYLARIIAVADVYDAVTSDRVYKDGVSAFTAFSIIKDESFAGLDPAISEVFLSNIAAYFINNRVKLSDGNVGRVVYVNKYALNRPLIRLDNDDYVDLSMDYSIQVDEVMML